MASVREIVHSKPKNDIKHDLTPVIVPLGDEKVYIQTDRLQGSWKDKLSRLPLTPHVELRLWGRYGKDVLNELEEQLNFQFDNETRTFIEEIGNLCMGADSIIIAGNEEKNSSCIAETEDVDLLDSEGTLKGVKIMDGSGLSYILYRDGSIESFEHDYIQPDGLLDSFKSLYHLIESKVKEQALG